MRCANSHNTSKNIPKIMIIASTTPSNPTRKYTTIYVMIDQKVIPAARKNANQKLFIFLTPLS
jgi:hypothetical protein